ncbi:4.1 g protein [Anaeramoeba flamelloides]|uniref:4.1 g protein n=1 Tax=Anaeramoeba flamelloides TaxID=1746091 RepID=A0ABQ8Z5T7_9EUKA|nr:4.1 g protein [Anaeramoeba flamelloides]
MTNRQIMEEEDTSESSPFSDELLQNSFPKFAQQVPTIYKNNQARSQLYPQKSKTQQANYQGGNFYKNYQKHDPLGSNFPNPNNKQEFNFNVLQNTNQLAFNHQKTSIHVYKEEGQPKKYNLWNTEDQKKVIGIIVDAEDFVNNNLVDMHLLLNDLNFFPNKKITVPHATKIKNIFKKIFADPRIKKIYSENFLSEVTQNVIETLRMKYNPKGHQTIQTTIKPTKKNTNVQNYNSLQTKKIKLFQQNFNQADNSKKPTKKNKTENKIEEKNLYLTSLPLVEDGNANQSEQENKQKRTLKHLTKEKEKLKQKQIVNISTDQTDEEEKDTKPRKKNDVNEIETPKKDQEEGLITSSKQRKNYVHGIENINKDHEEEKKEVENKKKNYGNQNKKPENKQQEKVNEIKKKITEKEKNQRKRKGYHQMKKKKKEKRQKKDKEKEKTKKKEKEKKKRKERERKRKKRTNITKENEKKEKKIEKEKQKEKKYKKNQIKQNKRKTTGTEKIQKKKGKNSFIDQSTQLLTPPKTRNQNRNCYGQKKLSFSDPSSSSWSDLESEWDESTSPVEDYADKLPVLSVSSESSPITLANTPQKTKIPKLGTNTRRSIKRINDDIPFCWLCNNKRDVENHNLECKKLFDNATNKQCKRIKKIMRENHYHNMREAKDL